LIEFTVQKKAWDEVLAEKQSIQEQKDAQQQQRMQLSRKLQLIQEQKRKLREMEKKLSQMSNYDIDDFIVDDEDEVPLKSKGKKVWIC
jgi:hypothetical protein